MSESQPRPRVVPDSVLNELKASAETHPVFHVEDPLKAHACSLASLMRAARTHEERAPLDYLLGALHGLFRARQLGFQDRTEPLDDAYWKGPLTRVGYMQDGNVRTDGLWLAGFYFNAALARIAASLDRMVRLVEKQAADLQQQPSGETSTSEESGCEGRKGKFRKRLGRVGFGKWTKPHFVLEDGRISNAYSVYLEVNFLKHEPEGRATGRKVTMNDAIAGLGEVISFAERRVRLSGRGELPET